jgi:hypothetical protein
LFACTPWYQAYQKDAWQRRISENLGIDVTFASIEFPTPWHFRVVDLVCSDPETGKEILSAAQLRSTMDRSGWTVDLEALELNGMQLQNAVKTVHDWFLCRPKKTASLLKLNVPNLVIYDGTANTKMQNIEIALKPTSEKSSLWVRFSVDGQRFNERAVLTVERNHSLKHPTTTCQFRSHDIAIPCRILSDRFPVIGSFGDSAMFRGNIDFNPNNQPGVIELSGSFHSVELGNISASQGSPIRGRADLLVDKAILLDQRVQYARGSVQQTGQSAGSVRVDWLKQTTGMLNMPGEEELKGLSNGSLQSLHFGFEMNSSGLSITGQLPPKRPEWPSIVMEVDGQSIAGTSIPMGNVFAWLQSTSPKMELTADAIGRTRVVTDRR